MKAWLDGAIIAPDAPAIPVIDRGFMLGEGLFETMRVVAGKIQRLPAHRARFAAGCQTLDMPDCLAAFDAACDALSEHASGVHALRIQATRGDWSGLLDGTAPRVAAVLRPAPAARAPVRLVTAAARKDENDPLVGVKCTGYASAFHAKRLAKQQGADDALFLNQAGRVAEATTSNLMARHGSTVYAPGPREGALGGTTRQATLALLRADGYDIVEQLDVATLRGAEEVWLTSTLQGAVPVIAIDGTPFVAGAMTQSLQEALLQPEA